MIKTKIRKTENGHQVSFTIGHQTFQLQEQLPEEGITSFRYSKWHEEQLNAAFKNLGNISEHTLDINNCANLIKSMPINQAIQVIKSNITGQPITTEIDGKLVVSYVR